MYLYMYTDATIVTYTKTERVTETLRITDLDNPSVTSAFLSERGMNYRV